MRCCPTSAASRALQGASGGGGQGCNGITLRLSWHLWELNQQIICPTCFVNIFSLVHRPSVSWGSFQFGFTFSNKRLGSWVFLLQSFLNCKDLFLGEERNLKASINPATAYISGRLKSTRTEQNTWLWWWAGLWWPVSRWSGCSSSTASGLTEIQEYWPYF